MTYLLSLLNLDLFRAAPHRFAFASKSLTNEGNNSTGRADDTFGCVWVRLLGRLSAERMRQSVVQQGGLTVIVKVCHWYRVVLALAFRAVPRAVYM
ncbi:hypothetical protein SFRURICE_004416 [Spodoptera frugiperda]|uniref:SFRICE_006587 n=1 Tax=Spodoptera frugiperda TaxID=7108 RepID=A0A2H1VGN0_SPOFR|nr:hypothetical protein SFRURICE_004416 [Spodoptera frugiperda]